MVTLCTELRTCADPDNEDVVRGVLKHLFSTLPQPIRAAKHEETLHANGFCFVSALEELEPTDLESFGVPLGHAKLLMRKIRAPVVAAAAAAHIGAAAESGGVAGPTRIVKAAAFADLGLNGLPSGRGLRGWLIGYASTLRLNAISEARLTRLQQVVDGRGVVPVDAAHPDGDAMDRLMFDVLVMAGSEGLPEDLKLAFPSAYISGRQGMQCIGWMLRETMATSDESTAVLTEWFGNPEPVTKPSLFSAALVHHDRAVEVITATDRAPSDIQYRISINKLASKIPEAVRKREALEAVHDPVAPADLRAAYGKVAAKHTSIAVQRKAVAMYSEAATGMAAVPAPRPRAPKRQTTAPRGQVAPSNPAYRTKPCLDFARGQCKHGANCSWRHDGGVLDPAAPAKVSALCAPVAAPPVPRPPSQSGDSALEDAATAKLAGVLQKLIQGMSRLLQLPSLVVTVYVLCAVQLKTRDADLASWIQGNILPRFGSKFGCVAAISSERVHAALASLIADTAATVPICGADTIPMAANIRPMPPKALSTANGTKCIDSMCDLPGAPAGCMDGAWVDPDCPSSLLPTVRVCREQDLAFAISQGAGSAAFSRDGEVVIPCRVEGDLVRVPLLSTNSGIADNATVCGPASAAVALGRPRMPEVAHCAGSSGSGDSSGGPGGPSGGSGGPGGAAGSSGALEGVLSADEELVLGSTEGGSGGGLDGPGGDPSGVGLDSALSGDALEMHAALLAQPPVYDPVSDSCGLCPHCSALHQLAGCTGEAGEVAMAAVSGAMRHAMDGHRPYDPKCPWCVRGGMRESRSLRVGTTSADSLDPTDLSISFDFNGPNEPDVDGYKYAGVGVEVRSSKGFVGLQGSRSAADTLESIQQFECNLLQLAPAGSRIVAFHHDDDKSFRGVVERYARGKGWVDTHTGGYNSNSNARVERRIGMLSQLFRVLLLYATGGRTYYEALWGRGMSYASDLIDWLPWPDRECPNAALSCKPFSPPANRHVFGAYCLYRVSDKQKSGKWQPNAEMGIWVGLSADVKKGHLIVPIAWDPGLQVWHLSGTVTATTVRVYDKIFPLRMAPRGGQYSSQAFEDFVSHSFEPAEVETVAGSSQSGVSGGGCSDAAAEASAGASAGADGDAGADTSAAAGAGAAAEPEYEVELLRKKRVKQGVVQYLVKWQGYSNRHNTWVGLGDLNCPDLIQEYERSTGGAYVAECESEPPLLPEAIKAKRVHYGVTQYLVKWAGCSNKHNRWCSLSSLSCPDLIMEYERQLACVGVAGQVDRTPDLQPPEEVDRQAAELFGPELEHARTAVSRLMARQRLVGTVDDYLPGYCAEIRNILRRRAILLDRGAAAEVRTQHQVGRLRMLLELKRSGRRKGRLVVQGFREPAEWDDGSNVSPVAYMDSIRMLILMHGLADDIISTNDVSVAFLQAVSFDEHDKRFVSYKAYREAVEHVLRLTGPLYGQRCASKRWYLTVASWLSDQGYRQCKNEPCLFVHSNGMRVLLYCDDFLCRGSRAATLEFHTALESRFECGEGSRKILTPDSPIDFCGLNLSATVDEGVESFHIDQSAGVLEFLTELDLLEGAIHPTPMADFDTIHSSDSPLPPAQAARYKSMLGALHFFVRGTRWDICAAVSFLAQFNSAPTVGSMAAMLYLCGYLRGTVDSKLSVVRGGGSPDVFHYYTDSAHRSPRSQTGVLILMNGAPVHWRSNKQPRVADSPAVAEIYALKEGAKDAQVFNWVAEELGLAVSWPVVMQVDSKQAISFQGDTCAKSRIRGSIDLREDWVEELRNLDLFKTVHVDTSHNLADILTKPMKGPVFRNLYDQIVNFQTHNILGGHVYLATLVHVPDTSTGSK